MENDSSSLNDYRQAETGNFLILDCSERNRVSALQAFIVYWGIRKIEIAKRMGVSPSYAFKILEAETISETHRNFLLSMGIPENLLPQPKR